MLLKTRVGGQFFEAAGQGRPEKEGVSQGTTTLITATFSLTTLSIMGFCGSLKITVLSAIMLSVAIFYCYTDCHYAEYRYVEYRYAECRGASISVQTLNGCNTCPIILGSRASNHCHLGLK